MNRYLSQKNIQAAQLTIENCLSRTNETGYIRTLSTFVSLSMKHYTQVYPSGSILSIDCQSHCDSL